MQVFLRKKQERLPISMATAYDYPTARIEEEARIDIILVGDSVGTNVLGYESEREVTMEDMLHHLKAVVRGASHSCIMVDLPYGSAPDPFTAFENSRRLMDAGAHIVKIEGWGEKSSITSYIAGKGIAVCSHIGYNPQYHGSKGRTFGKDAAAATELVRSAVSLENAGAAMLLVEKVPEEVCGIITERVSVPVIGIGSGRLCDGQVLVFHDIVGLGWRSFRHARAYEALRQRMTDALISYHNDVCSRTFPAEENLVHVPEGELAEVKKNLQ